MTDPNDHEYMDNLSYYFAEIGDAPGLSRADQDFLFGELDGLSPHRLVINREKYPESLPEVTKPAYCTCDYPTKIIRMSGHHRTCPVARACSRVVEKIALHLYKLVVNNAMKSVNYGIALEDLIQEGNIGLYKAIWKFDNTLGFRASTYCTLWIKQAIGRALGDLATTIRIPVHIRAKYKKLLTKDSPLTPDEKEIMDSIKFANTASLDSLFRLDSEDQPGYVFLSEDNAPDMETAAETGILGDLLEEILITLPARQARILRMRAGLTDEGIPMTQNEIGVKYDLCRERIRQIEVKALTTLRQPEYDYLREYLEA